MSKLLPCPFCGNSDFEEHEGMVRCSCGIRLDVNYVTEPHGEKERRWNRRASSAPAAEGATARFLFDAYGRNPTKWPMKLYPLLDKLAAHPAGEEKA